MDAALRLCGRKDTLHDLTQGVDSPCVYATVLKVRKKADRLQVLAHVCGLHTEE